MKTYGNWGREAQVTLPRLADLLKAPKVVVHHNPKVGTYVCGKAKADQS